MLPKMIVAAALSVYTLSPMAEEIPTRFGALKITDDNVLMFKGKPLQPSIEGNNSLSLLGTYRQSDRDVVLLQDNGGSSCPALLHFVSVSRAGAVATPSFGTCTDLIKVREARDSITVTMPGFKGPSESKVAQQKATKETHVYLYQAGVLTKNGRSAK